MLDGDIESLVGAARGVQGSFAFDDPDMSAASVGAALRSASGAVYTGVSVEVACGIGFCAEHAAIAEMLKHRETAIDAVLAVNDEGVLSPCGRCREFMIQLTPRNAETRVVLQDKRVVPLRALLPEHWLAR